MGCGGALSSEMSSGIPTVEAFETAFGRVTGASKTSVGGFGGGCLAAGLGGWETDSDVPTP